MDEHCVTQIRASQMDRLQSVPDLDRSSSKLHRSTQQRHEVRQMSWSEWASDAVENQVLFASTKSLLDLPLATRETVVSRLSLPRYLLEQTYLESNGFTGHDVEHDSEGQPHAYMHWCRFIVKQTFENLAPKRTFTPYVPHNGKSDGDASVYPDLHGPQTIQYGWEWHKMWFFARWESSGARTFVCFDLPPRTSEYIQAELVHRDIHGLSHQDSPYYTLAIVVEGVMRVYNESVWSIRNLISQREARRAHDVDYAILHEIARHSTHVAETLIVATRTVDAICSQHSRSRLWLCNLINSPSDNGETSDVWDGIDEKLTFQLRALQGLADRSSATDARIQNEITLAFHVATQSDSKIQVQIGRDAGKEAAAMKAIAVVTMTFLPATFVSTLFGMGFFSTQPLSGGTSEMLIVSPDFWIFWAVSAPLTVITLALWWWWNQRRLRKDGNDTSGKAVVREV